MKAKIQYHHKSKHASIDKGSSQILTSSPAIDPLKSSKNKISMYMLDKNLQLDEDLLLDENTSFRNTIQSLNEKDNVNYFIESNSNTDDVFKMGIRKNKQNLEHTQRSEILFEDTDNKYTESSNKLLDSIISSLDYFKKVSELSFKNGDKVPTVKILKEDYEKLRNEYEIILVENKKLKEKNKALKENSVRLNSSSGNGNHSYGENINVNKFFDSLMFLQTKNEELEKENKQLKSHNEDLKERLKIEKKKRLSPEMNKNKSQHFHNLHSTHNVKTLPQAKVKNDQMETLLKEQISCMKKMLMIVQDGKDNNTIASASKKKNNTQNDYIDSDSVSNIHFEESFNVTNMSNSADYTPEHEVVNSSEKDNEFKNCNTGQKFEILLKPFEKNKKTEKVIENAIDDDIQKIPVSQSSGKHVYSNVKDFSASSIKTKSTANSTFSINYPKMNKKLGDFSHRVINK